MSVLYPLPAPIIAGIPPTVLAPMQDVTNKTFMGIIHRYGDPDYYFNEFFRVHESSRLDTHILAAITENPTPRPVFAQFIGHEEESFGRMIGYLEAHPQCAGVDLNLGCPAPKIYKKNVGGGLLRDMDKVDRLLAYLRERIRGRFSVKCRVGFDDARPFEQLLSLVAKHRVDSLTVHGRTVKQLYRGDVAYDLIKLAVQSVPCPVFANGNISSAQVAAQVQAFTGCHGVMIGRAAIRNPWIFRQCREQFLGQSVFQPTLADVRAYVEVIEQATAPLARTPLKHAGVLKKYLNFIAQSVDAEGAFISAMRRAEFPPEILKICDEHLLGNNAAKPFAFEPYPSVIARPNCEV